MWKGSGTCGVGWQFWAMGWEGRAALWAGGTACEGLVNSHSVHHNDRVAYHARAVGSGQFSAGTRGRTIRGCAGPWEPM